LSVAVLLENVVSMLEKGVKVVPSSWNDPWAGQAATVSSVVDQPFSQM
jgi:hypothetical protein